MLGLFLLFGLCGIWTRSEEARALMEDITEALGGLTDKEVVGCLDVPKSHYSSMKSMTSAGPGILRFAHLPPRFWVRFLALRGHRLGVHVIEDVRIGRAIEKLDQIEMHMAKAGLEESREERVG